jgi:hypothetical protein
MREQSTQVGAVTYSRGPSNPDSLRSTVKDESVLVGLIILVMN